MLRTDRVALVLLSTVSLAGPLLCFGADSRGEAPLTRNWIDIRSFQDRAEGVGKETEDWQPAFMAAVALAKKTGRPVYVPAGVFKIRKAIDVPYIEEPQTTPVGKGYPLRIAGEGQWLSIIQQMDDQENILNWSGPTYEKSFYRGCIKDLCLVGGAIAVNVKWHNYFTMDTCYIHGAHQYGVYAEGWSSQFINTTIRWCFNVGLYGGAHFNNITIRDGYYSRCGVGIYLNGGYGVRLDGVGIEVCGNSAIVARMMKKLSITNCYFEANGLAAPKYIKEGPTYPDQIYLGYANRSVTIADCIFRINAAERGGIISMSHCADGRITDNLFQPRGREVAVLLRDHALIGAPIPNVVTRLTVEDNHFLPPETKKGVKPARFWYGEESPGLIKRALSRGCTFEGHAENTRQGTVVTEGGPRKAYVPEAD